MAAVCWFQAQGFASALAVNESSSWRGFRSREIWERSQSAGPVHKSCDSGFSWASVASADNFRAAATRRAQKGSVRLNRTSSDASDGSRLSSGFWGSELRCNKQRSAHICSSSFYPLVEARLFGPAIFHAAKLRVLTLGKESKKGSAEVVVEPPRIYTVTHSDITAQLTLAIAKEINKSQFMGWYSRLQRDEVLAEWRKTKGVLMLHVHCHISGGNWLHYLIAKLRFFIFQKELPMVLEAILHGDRDLFKKHPELQTAPVYVYFHSNVEEYNRLEYWGPLVEATKRPPQMGNQQKTADDIKEQFLLDGVCVDECECCSRHATVIPIPDSLQRFFRFKDSQQKEQF